MNKSITIFGREPAVWVGVIEAFLAVLLSFGLGISQESYGPIMAFIVAAGGAIAALGTKDTLLGYLITAMKAGFVLLAVYGFTLTDTQVGGIIALVSVAFGLFQRTQTSPIADPVDPSPAQVVESPLPAPEADAEDIQAAVENNDKAIDNGEVIGVHDDTEEDDPQVVAEPGVPVEEIPAGFLATDREETEGK